MIPKLVTIVILSGIGGYLYRRGGTSAGTLWRDVGVSIITMLTYLLLVNLKLTSNYWLSILLSFGLSWGALSSYRYFLPKPKDYLWYHYALHGFFIALAMLPLILVTKHFFGFGLRCLVLPILISAWSHFIDNDFWEDFGRGFFIITTIPFLLL